MGADNRAKRAIAKIEFREDFAKLYHEAFRRQQPIAAPWTMLGLVNKAATIAGIVALIDEINRRLDHPNEHAD